MPASNRSVISGIPVTGNKGFGEKSALQNGEFEGNNLFSDIELTSYFCSVF